MKTFKKIKPTTLIILLISCISISNFCFAQTPTVLAGAPSGTLTYTTTSTAAGCGSTAGGGAYTATPTVNSNMARDAAYNAVGFTYNIPALTTSTTLCYYWGFIKDNNIGGFGGNATSCGTKPTNFNVVPTGIGNSTLTFTSTASIIYINTSGTNSTATVPVRMRIALSAGNWMEYSAGGNTYYLAGPLSAAITATVYIEAQYNSTNYTSPRPICSAPTAGIWLPAIQLYDRIATNSANYTCTSFAPYFYSVTRPDMTSASTATVCSGSGPNITLTSSGGTSTYAWTTPTNTNVTGGSASSGSTLNQALTASTASPGTSVYSITASSFINTSSVGTCVEYTPQTVTITVNPIPAINTPSPNNPRICNDESPNIALSSNTTGGTNDFTWTGTNGTNTTGASSSSGSTINQVLSNSGAGASTATYVITPTFTNAGRTCNGSTNTQTVTINPVATLNTPSPNNPTICSGTSPNITFSSTNTTGGTLTYSWTGTNGTNISGASDFIGSPINQTLTNSGTTASTATYVITPVYTLSGKSCNGTTNTQTVNVRAPLSAASGAVSLAACGTGTGTPIPYADVTASAYPAGANPTWTLGGTGGGSFVSSGTSVSTTSNDQIIGLSTTGVTTTATYSLSYPTIPYCTSTGSAINISPPNLTANLTAVSLENTAAATPSPHVRSNCKTCTVKDGNTYTYYDATGKIMMKIVDKNPPAPAELGSTEICVGYDYTPPTAPTSANVKTVTENYYGTQQPYLPRFWTIKPSANTDATVTLYFTYDELAALESKANGTLFQFSSYNTLVVSKFPGGGTNNYTGPVAGGVVVPASFSQYDSVPDHQVTFDVNSFSTFYVHPTIFPNAVLPVELTDFAGKNIGSRNELNWITASEINCEKFIIEKSDGGSWSVIGELQAAGNSNSVKNYQFYDLLPLIGNNFYRLKIVDFGGQYTYSNTINVPLTDAVSNGITSIYPNPTSDLLNVGVQSTFGFSTTLIVFDVLGKSVVQLPVSINKGYNISKLDVSLLNKGVYIVQFKDNENKIHTAKFVKQ